MAALVEVIRGELTAAEQRISKLLDMLALAEELDSPAGAFAAFNGVGEGAGTPPPGLRGDGPGGRSVEAPANAGALPRAERANGNGRPAVEAGSCAAATVETPRSAPVRAPEAPRAAGRPTPTPMKSSAERKVEIIAALAEGPRTTRRLSEILGVSTNRVEQLIKPLREDRKVVVVEKGGPGGNPPTTWGLPAVVDRIVAQTAGRNSGPNGTRAPNIAQIRTYVLECVREGAGLNELEIAAQLEIDREHVAMATGDLLADRLVVLRPDGTYIASEAS